MNIKHLSAEQYDHSRSSALERVLANNGKPTLRQFKTQHALEHGLVLLYGLATIIFVVAFAVSSQHVIAYANKTASIAHIPQSITGLTALVAQSWYLVHELGLLLLAEVAMVTFMIMGRITTTILERLLMYILAISCAAFVVWANLQSGLVWYLSVLIPAITIGSSIIFEHWFVNSIKEEKRIRTAYRDAVNAYEATQNNPTKHPDYLGYLRQAIFDALLDAQTGTDRTARRAWLIGLSVAERAYLADAEIRLNDWSIEAIAPTVPTAVPTATGTIVIHEGIDVIHANGKNGNGNGHSSSNGNGNYEGKFPTRKSG